MFPYLVAVAGRTVREHCGYSFSFEDGTTSQMVLDGEVSEHITQVLEEIINNTGMDRQVVVLTRSKALMSQAKTISEVFPKITFMTPFDHSSEEAYRVAHENINEIAYPVPPVMEFGTDASVSTTLAVWAWVRKRSTGEFDFAFGTSPVCDSNAAEVMAIIQAGVQGSNGRQVKIYSDSRNAIKILNIAIEDGGQTPEILRGRGRKNLPTQLLRLVNRHKAGLLEMNWVKGHSDHALNVLADQIATYARRRLRSETSQVIIRSEIAGFLKEFERNGTVCFP